MARMSLAEPADQLMAAAAAAARVSRRHSAALERPSEKGQLFNTNLL